MIQKVVDNKSGVKHNGSFVACPKPSRVDKPFWRKIEVVHVKVDGASGSGRDSGNE
jgi:hypothetical protein